MSLRKFLKSTVAIGYVKSSLVKVISGIAFAYLSGCAQKGDFGRPQESFIADTIGEELNSLFYEDRFLTGDIGPRGKYTGPKFVLTPTEIELRDISLHFHQALAADISTRFSHSKTARSYAENLTNKKYSHGPARVQYMMAQIDADQKWLGKFREVAPRIKFADQKREHAIRVKNLMLTNRDRIRTVSRIKENNQIIHKIFKDLNRRITNYQYAIERSRLETPDTDLSKLEMSLGLLRERTVLAQTEYDKVTRDIALRKTMRLKEALAKARQERSMRLKKGQLKGQDVKKQANTDQSKQLNSGKPDVMNSQVEKKTLEPLTVPSIDWRPDVKKSRWSPGVPQTEPIK